MKAMADSLPRRKRGLSIRMLGWIAVASMLAVALIGPSAGGVAAATGAIWTTQITCNTPAQQDANEYATGDTVHVRGSGFDANTTYDWTITGQPGGASTDPGDVVASGTVTTDATGYFCIAAYTIPAGDDGTYTVDAADKNDNYHVTATAPSNPPSNPPSVPASEPASNPPSVPASNPPSVPASNPPSGGVEGTSTPGITPPSTSTDIGSTGSGSNGWLIPILGIALLLSSLLLLTPSRTVRRRR